VRYAEKVSGLTHLLGALTRGETTQQT